MLVLLPWSVGAGAGEPLPHTLAVQVLQGRQRVPGAFVEEVSTRIGAEIERRPCTRAVVGIDETPEILLRVILDDALEETRYALSIGDRAQLRDPEADLASVSTFEIRWQAEIALYPGGATIRSRLSRAKAERRPAFRGEDAAALARSDAALKIAKAVRGFLCDDARKRIQRELRAAPPKEE